MGHYGFMALFMLGLIHTCYSCLRFLKYLDCVFAVPRLRQCRDRNFPIYLSKRNCPLQNLH